MLCSRDFRPLQSNTAPTFSCEASAFARAIEIQDSCSFQRVQPFAGRLIRLVWLLLTSAEHRDNLSPDCHAPEFRPVRDGRSPRVMRVTFTPYTRRIYRHTLLDGYRALKNLAFSPGYACLVCDFCSSGQSFACGFLQIPGHPGHPCRSANGSHHQGP
jgi:hypothetical protein